MELCCERQSEYPNRETLLTQIYCRGEIVVLNATPLTLKLAVGALLRFLHRRFSERLTIERLRVKPLDPLVIRSSNVPIYCHDPGSSYVLLSIIPESGCMGRRRKAGRGQRRILSLPKERATEYYCRFARTRVRSARVLVAKLRARTSKNRLNSIEKKAAKTTSEAAPISLT
jgi:hypothetical protein